MLNGPAATEAEFLTCDKDNLGSAKAITNNGGILDEEEYMEQHGCIVQRYWLAVDP